MPATTAVFTLILGSLLNSYNTLKLEERKFEFVVLKSVLDQKLDARQRTVELCDMVDAGLIHDPEARHRRTVIDGERPCAPAVPTGSFSTRRAYQDLVEAVGATEVYTAGVVSLELGFIKLDGRVIPYDNQRTFGVQAAPISSVVIEYFDQPVLRRIRPTDLRFISERTPTVHVLMLRDGRMIQLNNLFVRNGSPAIRVSLTNAGPLSLATVSGSDRMAMRGRGGVEAQTAERVSVGSPSREHHAFTVAQVESLEALLHGLCSLAPKPPTLAYDPYVSRTLAAQAFPLPAPDCDAQPRAGGNSTLSPDQRL